DHGDELDLAESDANALLEGLGLNPDLVGEIPIDAIRDRLANPAIRHRAEADGISTMLERLERLLAIADADDSLRLEWA
ncbi:hypothetical protein O4H25_15150, partial [Staphylococcus equorum]|nr:hypothetical protein [Staphylococcus equorum]